MPEEQDTGAVVPETEPSEVIGTPVEESTPGPEAQEAQDKVDKAEYERVQKELNKAQQEINLHKNKAEKAKIEALEESEKYKEAYEELKRKEEEREAESEAERAAKEAEELRDKILSSFSEEAQAIAKATNLYWDSATTEAEAEAQLGAKLKAIEEHLPKKAAAEEEDGPTVHANNPAPDLNGVQLQELSAAEMRKLLPKAPAR